MAKRRRFRLRDSAALAAAIGAAGAIAAAVVTSQSSGPGQSVALRQTATGSSSNALLDITSVTFAEGALTVFGMAGQLPPHDFVYAIAKPKGVSQWTPSRPVKPDNSGKWTAVIRVGRSSQPFSVAAIEAPQAVTLLPRCGRTGPCAGGERRTVPDLIQDGPSALEVDATSAIFAATVRR